MRWGRLSRIVLAAGSMSWLAMPAQALDPHRRITEYRRQTWQQEQGLPQNLIRRILQTRDGYLWMAGVSGLTRFDGMRFVGWNALRPAGSRNDELETVFEDSQGYLWVGIRQGGCVRLEQRAEGLRETPLRLPARLQDATVWSIHEDRAGRIWLCTEKGLFRWSRGQFETYTTENGLSNDQVRDFHEDPDGTIWIGTDGGLNRLRDGRFQVYTEKDGLPNRDVRVVLRDRTGELWVGTHGGGLCRFRDGRCRTFTVRDGLVSNRIRALAEDRDGNLWIGTDGGGLARLHEGRLAAFTVREGLSHGTVHSIVEDREGSLWVGTRDGLNRLTDVRTRVYRAADGLADDNVRALHQDAAGAMWVGSQGGLTRLASGRATSFTRATGLPYGAVWSLEGDGAGGLWIGTPEGSLVQLRDGKFVTYEPPDGAANASIRDLAYDGSGGLWIGTQSGRLLHFANGRFTSYGTESGLPGEPIYALALGAAGELWIGTDGRGVYRLREGKLTRFGSERARVRHIFATADGVVWIATRGEGLQRWQGGKLTAYTTRQGLPADIVYHVLEDDEHNLWMSSSNGVFRVSRRDLDAVAEGRSPRVAVLAFGRADGMPTVECSGASQPAGLKASDGTLWFATTKGMVGFDPRKLRLNDVAPAARFEELVVDENPLPLAPPVVVPAGKRRFEFRYTGLSLQAPEKVAFRYRLLGFDRDWIDGGTRRLAHYTNLPPGLYTFAVQARNGEGVWGEAAPPVQFQLLPFFHQTRWFYGACALLLVGLVWLVHRLRLHQLHVQFGAVLAERARMARELHDTLEQGLTAAAFQVQNAGLLLERDAPAAHGHLEAAREMIQYSLGESKRSIQDLRSAALQQGDLGSALERIARQLTAGTQVAAQLTVRGSRERLPSRVESQLLRIGQEALTNATKHAGARSIQIELDRRPEAVLLSIADDGRGFDPGTFGGDGHYGIVGMRERALSLKGRLEVRSAPGAGTAIAVTIPLQP
jgi:ligand-binding sensor domain-containing protein/signal transduction histidine kinase